MTSTLLENVKLLRRVSLPDQKISMRICNCMAGIIQVLQRWTEFKKGAWIFMPIVRSPHADPDIDAKRTSFEEELAYAHRKDAIARALRLLLRLHIIQRQRNPFNGQDRTWQYRLNLDWLEWLKALPGAIGVSTPLQGGKTSLEGGKTSLEGGKTANNTTRIDSGSPHHSTPQPTRPPVVVESGNLEPEIEQRSNPHISEESPKPKVKNLGSPKPIAEDQDSAAVEREAELKKAEKLGVTLNGQIRGLAASVSQSVLRNAIAALAQAKSVEKPNGFLRSAIRGQWQPEADPQAKQSEARCFVANSIPVQFLEQECRTHFDLGYQDRLLTTLIEGWSRQQRADVQLLCDRHPEWGIEIGPDGPQELEF